MAYKNTLAVSDNLFLVNQFSRIIKETCGNQVSVDYACSTKSVLLNNTQVNVPVFEINMKEQWRQIAEKYDLIFSLHCKQLFPRQIVENVKCINVHPGFNPYNRGWYPQVFSILNGQKAGATIHEIDEQLDHGAILAQREVKIEQYDTSLTAYEKIQQAEIELLKENLADILAGNYKTFLPQSEGNINLKKDFNALREIDLSKKVTMKEAIDYLRAMTHGEYKNAYFIDGDTKQKVYVSVNFEISENVNG